MSKILYPIGTKVILRKNKELPVRQVSPLYVTKYTKGSKTPYGVGYGKDGSTLRSNLAVGDLMSWEGYIDALLRKEESQNKVEDTAKASGLSRSEVDDIVKEAVKEATAGLRVDMRINMEEEMRDQIRQEVADSYRKEQALTAERKAKASAAKKETHMSDLTHGKTLRQLVKWASLSKDERVLRESGFLDEGGSVTEQGRRIIIDTIYAEDGDLQKAIVKAIKKTLPKASKSKDEDDE